MIPDKMARLMYLTFRSTPANDEDTDGMWCAKMNYPIEKLMEMKKRDTALAGEILEKRRSTYANELAAIDAALMARARTGDYKAAELIYRRFENWSPKTADIEAAKSPKNKTFADLIAEE